MRSLPVHWQRKKLAQKGSTVEALIIGVVGVIVVVAVTTLAPRVNIAAPLVLVVVGMAISVLPMTWEAEISPQWVLHGILPPLLYAAAVQTPIVDLRRNLKTISYFAVVLVVVSAVAVGLVLHMLIPDLPLAAGIAVGAVVSPTDAVAISLVHKSGVSARIVTVLEGEALFNDATALVLLRSAIAAIGVSFSLGHATLDFVYAVLVAVAFGMVVGRLSVVVRARIPDVSANIAISLIVPFIASIPADHLGASGLVAAVTAGLVAGRHEPVSLPSRTRVSEQVVWGTVNLLGENAMFLLMGLKLWGLMRDAQIHSESTWEAIYLAAVVVVLIVLVRAGFVAASVKLLARRHIRQAWRHEHVRTYARSVSARRSHPAGTGRRQSEQRRWSRLHRIMERRAGDLDYLAAEKFAWKDGVILVAAGMRGAITLAAAQLLPASTPHRSLLILIAFVVAAGTLIVQGGSLAWVVKMLGIEPQRADPGGMWRRQLHAELDQAALAAMSQGSWRDERGQPFSAGALADARQALLPQTVMSPALEPQASTSQTFVAPDGQADADADTGGGVEPDTEASDTQAQADADLAVLAQQLEQEAGSLMLHIVQAQRDALLVIRDKGTYPSAVIAMVMADLDVSQISIEARQRSLRATM